MTEKEGSNQTESFRNYEKMLNEQLMISSQSCLL
jgi:hypothetical protein